MTARTNIGHDLDPTGFRYLGSRGDDLVLGTSGDLTLGQGNCFRVTVGDGAVLRRVSSVGWTDGSAVELQLVGGISVASGTTSDGAMLGVRTTTGDTMPVDSYGTIRLRLISGEWVMVWGGTSEVPTPVDVPSAIAWTQAYAVNFASLADADLSDGAVTIDGKIWLVSNRGNAAQFAVNPDGTGLHILANAYTIHDISAQQNSPAIGITLAELLGLANPELSLGRVRIWVQADWHEAMTVADEHFSVMVGYSLYDSGQLQEKSWRIRQKCGVDGAGNFRQHTQHVSLTNGLGDFERVFNSQTNPPTTRYDVFMFDWWPSLMAVNMYFGRYTTRWPTVSEMQWCGKTGEGASGYTTTLSGGVYVDASYPFFAVTAAPEGGSGHDANVLLKKLRVEYESTVVTASGERPARSTAAVDTGILTIPGRARTATLFLSGDVTLDGVDIGASALEDGDDFELIVTGSGSLTLNHDTGGLGTGVVPFSVPAPTGESGIGVSVGGSVPVRNLVFRYLAAEGFAHLSGGMFA